MSKELYTVKGTIANVMMERIEEIDFYSGLERAKETTIRILRSPDIKQKDLAEKYVFEIMNMTCMSQLKSTITTYITGLRAAGKRARV